VLKAARLASKKLQERHAIFLDDDKTSSILEPPIVHRAKNEKQDRLFKPIKDIDDKTLLRIHRLTCDCKSEHGSSFNARWIRGHRLRQQRKTLIMFLAARSRSPIYDRLVRTLWVSGGGERNLSWTCSMLTSFGYVMSKHLNSNCLENF
jgi:hypothetical protein